MESGDRATGGRDLEDLYAAMKDDPAPLDLPALFEKLGVSMPAGRVVFDDAAPMAGVRSAITAKVSGS